MKTELQKKFEKQTPSLKSDSGIEYLQTFITWFHFQSDKITDLVKKYPNDAELGAEIRKLINE